MMDGGVQQWRQIRRRRFINVVNDTDDDDAPNNKTGYKRV